MEVNFEENWRKIYFFSIKVEPGWLRQLMCSTLCSICSSGFESFQFLYTCASMWIEWLGCHTGHQEVSKHCTKVNLRNPFHAGDKACKHVSFETQGRYHQKSRGLMSSNFFCNNTFLIMLFLQLNVTTFWLNISNFNYILLNSD